MLRAMKALISEKQRKNLRRRLNWLSIWREYYYDATRFGRASSALREPTTQDTLAAHLTMDYHRLEKGMALPEPRAGFGQDVIARLIDHMDKYKRNYGEDDLTQVVRGVLKAYRTRQVALNHCNPDIEAFLRGEITQSGQVIECGVIPVTQAELFPVETTTANAFIQSRRSVRQYTGDLVDAETLRTIATLAQRAPSVCNRQSGRLYVSNKREVINRVLKHQNGNRGFGHTLGAVFIVTSDLQAFTSLGERDQGFVDGGIFAMQTLAAIHAQKLGACMLNWSATSDRDKALRRAFNLPDTEVIITMIGCGHSVETPEVAVSPRISTDTILRFL